MTGSQTYTYTRFQISQTLPSEKTKDPQTQELLELIEQHQKLDADQPSTATMEVFPFWYKDILYPLGISAIDAWNLYTGITPLEEFCQNLDDEQVDVFDEYIIDLCGDSITVGHDTDNDTIYLPIKQRNAPLYRGGEPLSFPEKRLRIDSTLRFNLWTIHGMSLGNDNINYVRTTVTEHDMGFFIDETYTSYDSLVDNHGTVMSIINPDGFYETAQPSFSTVVRHYE